MKLDRTDRRILQAMQHNARISNLELAEAVGLSPTPCSRASNAWRNRASSAPTSPC